jgi:aspartate/methionine/tyrosine aminotransferase
MTAAAGARLLVDETYRHAADELLPAAASLGPHVIGVSSLSKAYGLPGIRMGWLSTGDPELMTTLLAAKEQVGICSSILDEAVAARVMARRTEHLAPLRERMARHRAIVADWVESEPRVEWVPPGSGVVCVVRLRTEAGVRVDDFHDVLLRRHRTYVGPGHWFGLDDRHMRVGFAWPEEADLRAGLARVSLAIDETSGQRRT